MVFKKKEDTTVCESCGEVQKEKAKLHQFQLPAFNVSESEQEEEEEEKDEITEGPAAASGPPQKLT